MAASRIEIFEQMLIADPANGPVLFGLAKEYEKAADLTDRDLERANQKARAARAYSTAGDTAKSRTIWAELASSSKNPSVAAEAKVRLGELSAKPAKKG